MDDPISSSARKLNTKYPKRVEKYKTEVLQKFIDRKLFHAIEKLSKKAKRRGTWTTKMQKKYNEIDKEATAIMLKAEDNCVQTYRFHTAWSVPLIQSSHTIKYWNLKLSQFLGRKVSPKVLETEREAAHLKDFTTTKEEVIIERNLARIHLRDLIKNADKIREEELRKRAEDAAQDGNL